MTNPEREHFIGQIRNLERLLRRWRLIAIMLLALWLLSVFLGSLLGVAWLYSQRQWAEPPDDRIRQLLKDEDNSRGEVPGADRRPAH